MNASTHHGIADIQNRQNTTAPYGNLQHLHDLGTNSPIHYPHNINASPYILNIALMNLLRWEYCISNPSELSSDHNPIILHINGSPIRSSPPIIRKSINGNKSEAEINNTIKITRNNLSSPAEIDREIDHVTTTIQSALSISECMVNQPETQNKLIPDILLEIPTKQILR